MIGQMAEGLAEQSSPAGAADAHGAAADRAVLPDGRAVGDGRAGPHGLAAAHSIASRGYALREQAEGHLYAVVTPDTPAREASMRKSWIRWETAMCS